MAGVRRSFDVGSAVALAALLAIWVSTMVFCNAAAASPPRYELVERFGPDGTEASTFEDPGPVAVDQQTHFVYAAAGLPRREGPAVLYKFNGEGQPVPWGGAAPYLTGNELSGIEFAAENELWRQIAVDSLNHTIYVTSNNEITAFQENGEPSKFTAGIGAGTNSIGGFSQLSGIAVDSNGDIYASDARGGSEEQGEVKIFAPSGEPLTHITSQEPANLAVDSTGAVYVARESFYVTKYQPSSFPVSSSTTYTAAAPLDSEFETRSVAVNPANDDVYVGHSRFGLDKPAHVSVYNQTGALVTTFGTMTTKGELGAPLGIAVDGATTRVYVGSVPQTETSSPQVYVFRPELPAKPAVDFVAASGLSNTSATLYARINPDQQATTYRFEYGLGDCAVTVCTSVPVGGASIASGNDPVLVSQSISGLSPGTSYHYRVIAENALGSDEASAVFETQGNNLAFALSDTRGWEMVSPSNKRGAKLQGTQETIGGAVQAAANGNGIAYVTAGSIEGAPEGNRMLEASSVLAQRGADGWQSKDITVPNAEVSPLVIGGQGEYKLFSPDLAEALLEPRSATALSAEASELTPYLRRSDPLSYRPLVTGKEGFANVPPGTEFGGGHEEVEFGVEVLDATPRLDHVVLRSNVPLAEGAPSLSLYEWAAGTLSPVSVLPEGEGEKPAEITEAKFLGSGGGAVGNDSMRHAISDSGSRLFWTGFNNGHLYMRDMEAGETIRLDEIEAGTGEGKEQPVFQGANTAGTVAFFTDFQQLTPDSGASFNFNSGLGKADLYMCEMVESGGSTECELHDLTPKVGSEVADVQGMISGLGNDGSSVYFVAKGVLTAGANQFGASPAAGQPNLYLWQEGGGLRFVATLSAADKPDWGLATIGGEPPGLVAKLSTATSPSGRYFAFMSSRNITNQESVDVGSGKEVERVFRYDAATGRLACISCAPDGASPRGMLREGRGKAPFVDPHDEWLGSRISATLPQPEFLRLLGEESAYQPRGVLDNGRVFFNSFDSLVPADSNGQWDVYQYEDLGVGDCNATSGSTGISRSGEGCVSLMSSGTGESEAGFFDASESGNDVFFVTSARLAATDVDNELDLYDARVGGGFPGPSSPNECNSGETCHPASPQIPEVAPNSSSFTGTGNVKTGKKCPRGKRKVKQHGKQRCIRREGKKHHRRAKHGKGAGR